MRLVVLFFFVLAVAPAAFSQPRPRAVAHDTSTFDVATYTVQVTPASARVEARAASKGRPRIQLFNGKSFMHLTSEFAAQTVEASLGTSIIVHAPPQSYAAGFIVSPPGILEPTQGIHHLPQGILGILHTVGHGTATITIKGVPPRANLLGTAFAAADGAWSGYKIKGGPFLSVTGSWTVPTVYGDAGDHSATWIGIDGDVATNNDTIIQVGTGQDYSSGLFGTGLFGGPNYYAWYETYPDDPNNFSNPVSPGDHMTAIISLTGDPQPGSPMTWLIFLMNQTQNWAATKSVTYSGVLSTAEWIVEAPQECFLFWCSISDLADYGSVSFDGFDLVNSASPSLVPNEAIKMIQGGNTVSVPSDPDGDSDGFTLAFGSNKPLPPGPIIETTSLPDGFLNTPYTTQLFAIDANSFQWSANSLPSWLTLDRNSGILSGTPPVAGIVTFDVVARDTSNLNISSKVLTLGINVQETTPPPTFNISASPVVIYLTATPAGCIGKSTITVNSLYGFSDLVHLTASGAGVTSAVFSPSSTHSTSQLTLHSSLCHGTSDEHLISVTGTSGAITRTVSLDLVPQVITGGNCNIPGLPPIPVCPPTKP